MYIVQIVGIMYLFHRPLYPSINYIFLSPCFHFPSNIFNWCTNSFFIYVPINLLFCNLIVLSVVQYLWLFVVGYYKSNISYLFQLGLYPVVIAGVVIGVGLLFFCYWQLLSCCLFLLLCPHPNVCGCSNSLLSQHHHYYYIRVDVCLYVLLLYIHLFFMYMNQVRMEVS